MHGDVSGEGVGISLAELGVGRACTVCTSLGPVDGMEDVCGDGTGEVCSFVGAGVGIDKGIELGG